MKFEIIISKKTITHEMLCNYIKKNNFSQIIVENKKISNKLKLQNIECKTFREIFKEDTDKTFEIYAKSKENLEEYRKRLQIKFLDSKIFQGIENIILEKIIIGEETKKILSNHQNTVFIFDHYESIYFSLLKIAEKMNYKVTHKIIQISKEKISEISSGQSLKDRIEILIDNVIRLTNPVIVDSDWFNTQTIFEKIKFCIKNYNKSNLAESEFDFKKLTKFALKAVFYLFISKFGIDMKKRVLKEIEKKGFKNNMKDNFVNIFCTTNSEDTYLKVLYPVLEKMNDEKINYSIIKVDFITSLVLKKRKIPHLGLFEEIRLLTMLTKRDKKIKELKQKIFKIIDEYNLDIENVKNIEHNIHHVTAIILGIDVIFEKFKINKVLGLVDGVYYVNTVNSLSQKYGFKNYTITPVIINKNPLHKNWITSDKILVYGTQGYEVLKELGYDPKKIIITGNPRYDHIKDEIIKLKTNKTNYQKKKILVAMARWHNNDEIWMSKFIKFCNDNKFEITIKIHPMYKGNVENEISKEKVMKIWKKCFDEEFTISYDLDLNELISSANIIITDYSNVGVQAAIYEKSLITVNFEKEDWKNEQKFYEDGGAIYCEKYQDLEFNILEIFNNNMTKKLEEGRKILQYKYNFLNDGNASIRILKELRD